MARVNTGVRFYLKEPTNTNSAIVAVFYYNYITFKYSEPKLRIEPKYWNSSEQRAKSTKSFPESAILNETLKAISTAITDSYRQLINDFGKEPDKALLLNLVKQKRGRTESQKAKPISLFEFIESFISEASEGKHLNLNRGKSVTDVTIRTYSQTLRVLREYSNLKYKELQFEDIDTVFHGQFIHFLTKEYRSKGTKQPFKINTVGKHLTNLKTFMRIALDRRLTTNDGFKVRGFKVIHENIDTAYLTKEEIKALYEFDLSKDKKLEKVRDMFIIGCDTGLRISDLKRLRKENIYEENGVKYLRIEMQKTEKKVSIPISKTVEEIIYKYELSTGEYFPRAISDQRANDYIKEAASKVDLLKKEISITKTVNGARVSVNVPKFELISNHTGRRSFATNCVLDGISKYFVMQITGHVTEKSFNRYLRMDDMDSARMFNLEIEKLKSLRIV